MKAGIQAIIMKINEDADQSGRERYTRIKETIDQEIESENALYRDESGKQREVLRKHNEHEYERRFEYERSRVNRELLIYQQELTGEIFGMAVEKLRNASADEFSSMFKAAVAGLKGRYTMMLGALSEGKLDGRALGEAMAENEGLDIALSPETVLHKSGFILKSDNVEYNHLFEDLVDDMKSKYVATIMKEVFGSSENWMFS